MGKMGYNSYSDILLMSLHNDILLWLHFSVVLWIIRFIIISEAYKILSIIKANAKSSYFWQLKCFRDQRDIEKVLLKVKHVIVGNRHKPMIVFLWQIIMGKKPIGGNGENLILIEKTYLPFSFNHLKMT